MALPPPITSRSNARVKALRASLGGDARRPGDLLGIEGEHLIAEALRSKLPLDTLFIREGSERTLDRPALAPLRRAEWIVLSPDVFDSAVDTASPQGIAATLPIPDLSVPEPRVWRGSVLVVEAVQDPGNLGTLIRAAEAFDVTRIFITPETVNPWSPKVVRASAGSAFRVAVERRSLAEIKEWATARHVWIFAAVAEARGARASMDADLTGSRALMVGNEGAGLSAAALAIADERVHIPCMAESLNVAIAGSTLMYEALRQRILQTIPAGAAQ